MKMHKYPNIEALLESVKGRKLQYFDGPFEADLSHTTKPPQKVVFKEGHMLPTALIGYFGPPDDRRIVALWTPNNKDMAAGTYELGPDKDYQGGLQVGAIDLFYAHEGTLTINEASATSRTGKFNFKAGEYEVDGTFEVTVQSIVAF
ncbi:hypothetical protein [Pseudomonas sichuanensis]|uniref:hypothetical protein n=1 Tax=Pseudomonas sichuanensis TaxID=2213015 RepID=UPI002AB86B9B|nr:hypothetical protein [Pseudomonas sichuanensis]MDZ4021938.1 hypothetical protein [Pseudomonas sichuanensis]